MNSAADGGNRKHHRHHTDNSSISSWIGWAMKNKIVMIIVLLLVVIFVVPWLICDVLGLKPICTIISGIVSFISTIFKFVGLG